MKRFIAILAICLLLLSSFSLFPAAADNGGFVIKDGVLLSYNGSASDVTVPSTVYAVGDFAFAKNAHIVSVTIPDSVESIGSRAFYGCSSLKNVRGGTNVTSVGVYAFNGTQYFERSTDEFLILGKTLVWYNGDSMYITVPESCVSIAPYAFLRSETVKMVRASSELVSVGAGAFYECQNLENVSLTSSVTFIGPYAFEGTPFLDSLGAYALLGDGILVKYQGGDSDVVIPDGIRRIDSHAFRSSKLSSVSIPGSVYSIDPFAFADCIGLSSVTLSEGLVMIGDGAFRGCRSLSGLTTPDTLAYIGQHAFDSSGLENIRLHGDRLIVSDNAFKDCKAMKYALLANGVDALYDGSFAGCTALEGISVPSDASDISSAALSGCEKVVVTCAASSAADTALSNNSVNNVIGDADRDGELSILDATEIQCNVAGLVGFSGAQTAAADFDFNGVINIIDAADVQMSLADLL